MNVAIQNKVNELGQHEIYAKLDTLEAVQTFMQYHVFAVWDFMSLIKRLQREVTCLNVPWTASRYPGWMVRLINSIVKDEESDLALDGSPLSHYQMYLAAMANIGASQHLIHRFLEDADLKKLDPVVAPFVQYSLDVALHGHPLEVAGAFFFGREKIVPVLFREILPKVTQLKNAKNFVYYLERHIELDSGEHSEEGERFIHEMAKHLNAPVTLAADAALKSLEHRYNLWSRVSDLL